jgi:hypothetical protein
MVDGEHAGEAYTGALPTNLGEKILAQFTFPLVRTSF